jgi:hypothetical protein
MKTQAFHPLDRTVQFTKEPIMHRRATLRLSPLAAALSGVLAALCAAQAIAQTINTPTDHNSNLNAPQLVQGNSNLATPGLVGNLSDAAATAQVRKVILRADKDKAAADGRSVVRVTLQLLGNDDQPVKMDVPVLLEASRGRIVSPGQGNTALEAAIDRDRTAVGTQATVKNGEFSFDLIAPGDPGQALVRASVGLRQQTVAVNFEPDLREMIAVGLVEGAIVLRNQKGGLQPVRPSDGFEQEIRRFQYDFNNGKAAWGVRAGFFLKGKISGSTLLTAAYDSDKDVRDRMFRDIRADEFYPVYGDASLKGYDAQTSGRFYVRVDNGKNYALFGDFNTAENLSNDIVQLGRYSRSLTGIKSHWENERVSATVFVSRDNLRQVVDELPGKGISGPYTASFANGVQNTEKVEILVRDRNAPSVVLRSTPQVRFVDYDFEPFSGRILFKSPIPSLDENLNPVSIRIAYEVEEGGLKYWVGGGEARIKLGESIAVGGTYAKDQNPLAKYELGSVNLSAKLGASTELRAEIAHSRRGDVIEFGSNSLVNTNNTFNNPNISTANPGSGDAWRAELRHQADALEARAYVQRVDNNFSNPSASVTAGRTEFGGKATYAITPSVRLIGEGLSSEDLTTQGKRSGLGLSAAWDVTPAFTLEAGMRYAKQSGAGATVAATAFGGSGTDPVNGGQTLLPNNGINSNLNQPYDETTARLKATYRPISSASVYAEAEQDIKNSANHAYAVGGDYRFSEVGRVYTRSEWATGLAGRYGLAGQGKQNATVLGVDAQYMKDGTVFSEYRLRDAIAGRESVAAVGLRNYWAIVEGWRLSTTVERVRVLDGPSTPEATAAGVGMDYTGSPLWKASGRVEWRDDTQSTSWLSTAALARKLSDDWTMLGRNYFFRQNFDNGNKNHQDRFQLGFAWRETQTNVWNALGLYEFRKENTKTAGVDDLDSKKHIVSVDADYHPTRTWWVAGKVAGKWVNERLAGVPDTFSAQLLQGRLIYDVTDRWDVGLTVSMLGEKAFKNRRFGYAAEVGRVMTENLWLTVGYSFTNLKDKDLLTGYSSKGVFIKLRWKFDENLFKRGRADADKSMMPTP